MLQSLVETVHIQNVFSSHELGELAMLHDEDPSDGRGRTNLEALLKPTCLFYPVAFNVHTLDRIE